MSTSSRKDAVSKRGGFTSLNLHQSYRGGRPESKGSGKSHGMQTLGRIGATSRRMPAPASLPSLKSENAGNDPTVNLVPTGGSGWTNKKEDKENKAVNNEVRRLGPEQPPKSPGKKFKVDFPSLEEQEAMSKRELEELERRQREEQELREREGEEERERSPESGGGRPRGWREPPPPHLPHGHHGPPLPPNMGPYPHRGGPYAPHHYPPHMMPPPRHGMPPYVGVPPMHGPRGHYPPPHHMQFRPPFHHPGYPPHNPYEIDPYKMPSRKGDDVSRPPTVKADDLKSMDVPDEEEGGWAGHHEEVDYTKEVIFSDSSDDESVDKLGEVKKKHELDKEKPSKEIPTGQDDTGVDLSKGQEQEERKDLEAIGSVSNGRRHSRERERLPNREIRDGDYEGRNWDREYERERDHKPEGGWGDYGPDGGHPRQMPPYHYPQYPYPPPPPPPPPYADPYGYPYPQPPGYPVPPHGYPLPSQQRYGSQRGTKRGHSEREEAYGRHDFHPLWTQQDVEYRSKRKWSSSEERPRILSKPDSQKVVEGRSDSEQKEKGSALKRTDSASSDTQRKHHVTFADDAREKSESPTDDPTNSAAVTPVTMRHPKRIVMRKLGENESPSDKQDQPAGAKGLRERPKDLKTSGELKSGNMSDSPDSRSPDSATKGKQMAWNVNNRGPITSPKTLYEPEGRRSEAKFMKYRRDAGELSHKGKGEKGGKRPSTPSSETEQPKAEQEPKEDDNMEITAQVAEKEGVSKTIEKRIEQRPGLPDRPQRQDSGRLPHDREREKQGSREKPRHRKDDVRRPEGGGTESEHQDTVHEKSRERGRERSDHRKLDSHSRGEQLEVGQERGEKGERVGFRSQELRHDLGRDQDRDKPARKEPHHDPERREGERRRDFHDDARQQDHWKDQNQTGRGRSERHPSRGEPPKRDSRSRRQERRPREHRSEGTEHVLTPTEGTKDSAVSGQPSSLSGGQLSKEEEHTPIPIPDSEAGGRRSTENPIQQTLVLTEGKNPPEQPLDQRPERKRSKGPRREDDQIHLRPSRGGQRRDDREREREKRGDHEQEDGQIPVRPFRGGQRRGGDHERERERRGGDHEQERERERRGDHEQERERRGDRERERERRGGGDHERDRERSGRHPPRERDRDRGGLQRDRERKQRPYGKQQPSKSEASERERESKHDDKKIPQDSKIPLRGEKHGRQRDRQPHLQQKLGAERVPERGANKASSQHKPPQWTRGKPRGSSSDWEEEAVRDSRHKVPEEKRDAIVRHVEQPGFQAESGKPALGYGEVIDIESGSDWEEEASQDQTKPPVRKQAPKRRGEKGDSVSMSRLHPRAEQGERTVMRTEKQLREEKGERGNQREDYGGREFRRVAGRGRGRVEDGKRERKGHEATRPGSYSSQRRQPAFVSREDGSKQTERRLTAEGGPVRIPSIESLDDLSIKSKEKGGAQAEKKSESFHKNEFEKYDLNSLKVSIVDDIGGEGGEEGHLSPAAQAEFVEVTSKKTLKEKLKKEKEEQRKQDEEKRRHEEERTRKSRKSTKPLDRSAPSQSAPKSIAAWGPGTDNTETSAQDPVWASPTTATSWQSSSLLRAGTAAPGAQLKAVSLVSNWSSGTGGLNVGVIGDNLQSKALLATPGSSELLSAAPPLTSSSYSLFGYIGPTLPSSMVASGMLNAAVDSTMPGLSEDALRSTSKEDPLVMADAATHLGAKETQPIPPSDESAVKEKDKEIPEFQKVERGRVKVKSLPPRFQNSKPPPQPQQQQQQNHHQQHHQQHQQHQQQHQQQQNQQQQHQQQQHRHHHQQQQQQRVGPGGRGRGSGRSSDRREKSSGGSGNRSEKHTQSSGGSSGNEDRFYIHPRARSEASKVGQKSGDSGGEKQHSQQNSKPPPKPGSANPTKVASGGVLELKVASCSSSPDLTDVIPLATGQQSPRAGSGSGNPWLRATSNDDKVKSESQTLGDGGCTSSPTLPPVSTPTPSPFEGGQSGCSGVRGSPSADAERGRNSLPRRPISCASKDGQQRPEGHVASYVQRSRLPPPSTKSVSYADALKTKLTTPEHSASNSKVSSRSQTPSETSSLIQQGTKDTMSHSITSSRCSTPPASRPVGAPTPSTDSKLTRGPESRSQCVQSSIPDGRTGSTSVAEEPQPAQVTGEDVIAELCPPCTEAVMTDPLPSLSEANNQHVLVDQCEKKASDIASPESTRVPESDRTATVERVGTSEAAENFEVANEYHTVLQKQPEAEALSVGATAMSEASDFSEPLQVTTVSQPGQSSALNVRIPAVPEFVSPSKASIPTGTNLQLPGLPLSRAHPQQERFNESTLQAVDEPMIPQGDSCQRDTTTRTSPGLEQTQASAQQEGVLPSQASPQLPSMQTPTIPHSSADHCTQSFKPNSPQESLSKSQQQCVSVPYCSPDALPTDQVSVSIQVPGQQSHANVVSLNQRGHNPHVISQQQQLYLQKQLYDSFCHQHQQRQLYQQKVNLAHLQSQASQLNYPKTSQFKPSLVGLVPNDSLPRGFPVPIPRMTTTLQERTPPHSSSAFTPYLNPISHPQVTPPIQVSEAQFLPGSTHPVYSQGVLSQQEQNTPQLSLDRDQRGESVESSKSGLSITATPFIPGNGSEISISAGAPVPPLRKMSSSNPVVVESNVTTVPITSIPQNFSHPPGFERHPPPPSMLFYRPNMQVRVPHTFSGIPPTVAPPLIGPHPIPPQIAAAAAAPAAMQPIPVAPQQQLHIQRKSPLQTPLPSQHVQNPDTHPAAYQVISMQDLEQLQALRRQALLQDQLPSHLIKMHTLPQESHIPHRKLAHPHMGDHASINAMELQAKGMPLNPRMTFSPRVQNPGVLDSAVYTSIQPQHPSVPLARAPSANSSSKRALLPTPQPYVVPHTSHVVSPGQNWQVRAPLGSAVRLPFPQGQQRYTYNTSTSQY